nr:NAD-dependent epimerase/dehydratase family protein [Burkholderia diffusa]
MTAEGKNADVSSQCVRRRIASSLTKFNGRSMYCLLLGGGGFIGAAVARELLGAGHRVRIFERPTVPPSQNFASNSAVDWMSGDFLNKNDIALAVDGVDAVLHLVSTTLPKNSNDDPTFDVQSNVIGTLQLLDQMVKHDVKRMVFASSGGTVYGIPQHIPIVESHPTDPLVSYGITKLAIEKYLELYRRQHALQSVVLRVANPYGSGQRLGVAQGAVGEFIHRALTGDGLEIWGDGSVVRDYLYVSDVARAFRLALDYQGRERVFNIGSGVGTSVNELVAAIEFVLARPIERRYSVGRSFDVPVSVLDITSARQELGWMPTVSLIDGLKMTVASMMSTGQQESDGESTGTQRENSNVRPLYVARCQL